MMAFLGGYYDESGPVEQVHDPIWCDQCGIYHGDNVPCDEGCIECGSFAPRGKDGKCKPCREAGKED
jgi:hypothetical protein